MSFAWRDGERLIRFGRGEAAGAVATLGGPGYLLLTTPRAAAALPAVAEAAGAVHEVPAGTVPPLAAAALEWARGEREPRIAALGGGRVIDVAKAVAAALGGDARALAIPTTLSGAEMTRGHRHAEGVDEATPRVRCALVIADPALSASQPEPELAASALNALGHAAEAPVTTLTNPVATLAAHQAARLIAGAYAGGTPDRDALALGAMLAGYGIDSAWYGLHHVLSQTLVRLAGIGHGAANAIMLQHSLGALAWRFPQQMARLGEVLGEDPQAVAARLCALTAATTLGQLGVSGEDLQTCADAAAARAELDLTPPRAERGEILALYEHAL